MNKFGIIATEDERISRLKWYNFAPYQLTESFIVEHFDAEAVAFYANARSIKHLEKLFIENRIRNAVCTERFIDRYGEISVAGVSISNGVRIYQRLLPDITKKAFKVSGIEGSSGTLAVSEDNPELALSIIHSLCNDFRYITVITKNKKRASAISDKILDEYGLPVIIADNSAKVNCDIAVKTGINIPNLPKDTILIDACCENNITRKNTINWAEISIKHNLPFKIDTLALAQCLESLSGALSAFKISGFKSGKNIIKTSMLCREYN